MKKSLVMALALGSFPVWAAEAGNVVKVDADEVVSPAAPDLWGIFFEDIDLSLDGGVYAEMVRNRSFEDGNGSERELPLEYWNPVGNAEYFLSDKPEGHRHDRHCLTVRGPSGAGVSNEGYFGMGVEKGAAYNLSFALKGKGVKAVAVTRKPFVRLFLDNELVGEARTGAENAYRVEFDLLYRPGTLELVAVGKDGSVDTVSLRTAGPPKSIRFSGETVGELEYVTAEAVDAAGTVCEDARLEVSFDGEVLATCSGDMTDAVLPQCPRRKLYKGRAMAVRRANAAK